jgi:ATP-dependent RNA helicase DDX23/PRP28
MAPGSEPLSIESLLQKQKEEREAAARVSCLLHAASTAISLSFQPKFLTREDRARIAIAKRAQEIQEEKRKEEDNRKNREQLEREAEVIRRRERESKYSTSSSARCRSVSCAHAPC